MKCPVQTIAKCFAKLKVWNGLPVPHAVQWFDDKPDFRVIDRETWLIAATHHWCGVCGQPLGEKCYYIGGPVSFKHKMFTDLPMHRVCVEESIKICPFLNKSKTTHRLTNLPDSQDIYVKQMGIVDTDRPEKLFLLEAKTKQMRILAVGKDNGAFVVHAGNSLCKVKGF